MSQKIHDTTPGYYLLTIGTVGGVRFLRSNNERAFIIAQLQDLLNTRSILEEPTPHRRLAAHIDLLAFSIQPTDIRLIIFSISRTSLAQLSRSITQRLLQFQSDNSPARRPSIQPTAMIIRLAGPHNALLQTLSLHLRHTDWEYDRYSSIGFYLHDRRGDWMRLWRLARLYKNRPSTYRHMLHPTQPKPTAQESAIDTVNRLTRPRHPDEP